jgi:hypothetical protein
MKYLFALIGDEGAYEDRPPEETRAALAEWQKFTDATVESGAFIAGEGLQPSGTATTVHVPESGERTVTDGPFTESKEQLGGFYLLECKDLDEALSWAKKIPVQGGAVEVRPVMDYEGLYESPPADAAAASS